jgi:hypothetical protein
LDSSLTSFHKNSKKYADVLPLFASPTVFGPFNTQLLSIAESKRLSKLGNEKSFDTGIDVETIGSEKGSDISGGNHIDACCGEDSLGGKEKGSEDNDGSCVNKGFHDYNRIL